MTYPLLPTAADLTFEFPAHSAGPGAVDLTFGAVPPPVVVHDATFNAKFVLRGSVTVDYDSGQWRGLRSDTVLLHQQAAPRPQHTSVEWEPGVRGIAISSIPHQQAQKAPRTVSAGWSVPTQGQRMDSLLWGRSGRATGTSADSTWGNAKKAAREASLPWNRAAHRGSSVGFRHGYGKPTPQHVESLWQEAAQHQHAVTTRMNQMAKAMKPFVVAPWQTALVVASYGGPMFLPPPQLVDPTTPPVIIDMRFCALYPESGRTNLVFGLNLCGAITPDSLIYILPARFYMSAHNVEAFLLPSNTPIPIFDLQLAADVSSTSWSFSATTTFTTFDSLVPTAAAPKQIKVVVDGMEWVFVVDRLSQSENFGGRKAKISGRSQVALLGDPYQRQRNRMNTVALSAQQIAASVLTPGEVGAGWDVDWGITDWLIPIGAWSHTGTPLASIQAVANAVGGYVNAHRTNKTVLIRHPYPTLPGGIPGGPWNWEGAAGAFVADVEIAPDAIISRSIERSDGADIDGVYVGGTVSGAVEALVRRSGTLGAKLAPMQTDALITAVAAATQRGYATLGMGGAKHKVQITMPVLTGGANPGVLDVGQLVQINDSVPWRGRVRAVSVNYNQPSLRQQVTLERHLS